MSKQSPLIVALDVNKESDALALVDQLDPSLCALKVGSELFTLLGPAFVRGLVSCQFRVFLDLKFHDIPNTVARACAAAADLGVWMMNVHASGGLAMMRAASQALGSLGDNRPLLIAVTVLTSTSSDEFETFGYRHSLEQQVETLALLAHEAGLDGVVSSAFEVPLIKSRCGRDFLTVTPGIRLASDTHDDQSRVVTPQLAIEQGSDYLVVGRPITRAEKPIDVVHQILNDVHF